MPTSTTIRPSLVAAKEQIVSGREALREQHLAGLPGIQLCAQMTDLVDGVLLDLIEEALADLGEDGDDGLRRHVAFAPNGGYGRRDIAPYSDVDLMILHEPAVEARVRPLAERLMKDLYDVGFDVGWSVRTPRNACQFAFSDPVTFTALIEARLLTGSVKLFRRFMHRFESGTRRRARSLQAEVRAARRDERHQFGETVFLLEPNIKRSKGGLRDIQLLRWIGFAVFGTPEPSSLRLLGHLDRTDEQRLRRSMEFLLRLRNEMHFHAGRPQDVLGKAEQMRLAEVYGYEGTEGVLPVEQFMQEYFLRISDIYSVASHFVKSVEPRQRVARIFAPLLRHQVERDFLVGPNQISATRRGLEKLKGDLSQVLRLADLANLYDKRIDHVTWETVRQAAKDLPADISAEDARRFLSVLSQPAQLGRLLRRLHDLGVLEKFIPEFAHARGLLQFNEYHKYTVDEHCLRAVERATDLLNDEGPAGRVYRKINEKRTLHLALLIHDLGKGYPEDHSELGAEIAQRTAQRLRLPQREAETLRYLVLKHLTMAHLAFRRDTTDEKVILDFAVDVGSPEVLRMLFVLTLCDFAAVGPDVLNDWKIEVLADLYRRTMQHLAGDAPAMTSEQRVDGHREQVRTIFSDSDDRSWFHAQINALPVPYLYATPPERIGAELRQLRRISPGKIDAWARYLSERDAIEFTVGGHEGTAPGIFHRLAGALSSQGLQILSAEINTLDDGMVLDRFYVIDPDSDGQPDAHRIEDVTRALVDSLKSPADETPSFRRTWAAQKELGRQEFSNMPVRVRADNDTSECFTIIDVFSSDRMGLLFTIARMLYQLGLSVHVAKIGTYLDQVVDVFYVTDADGQKIVDENRIQEIRSRVLEAVEMLEEA